MHKNFVGVFDCPVYLPPWLRTYFNLHAY